MLSKAVGNEMTANADASRCRCQTMPMDNDGGILQTMPMAAHSDFLCGADDRRCRWKPMPMVADPMVADGDCPDGKRCRWQENCGDGDLFLDERSPAGPCRCRQARTFGHCFSKVSLRCPGGWLGPASCSLLSRLAMLTAGPERRPCTSHSWAGCIPNSS